MSADIFPQGNPPYTGLKDKEASAMKAENMYALERLSLFCHMTGIFSVFIGLTLTFFDALNKDMGHIQISIYVVITGYSFVKIAKRIAQILMIEAHPSSRY